MANGPDLIPELNELFAPPSHRQQLAKESTDVCVEEVERVRSKEYYLARRRLTLDPAEPEQ